MLQLMLGEFGFIGIEPLTNANGVGFKIFFSSKIFTEPKQSRCAQYRYYDGVELPVGINVINDVIHDCASFFHDPVGSPGSAGHWR